MRIGSPAGGVAPLLLVGKMKPETWVYPHMDRGTTDLDLGGQFAE